MTRILSRATLCSTLAIATALVAAPREAKAQFIGSATYEMGAHAHTLGNGQLVINVTSPQAVINWSATGASTNGLVTFQQAGATATFQGNGQFAILNRVTPTASGSGILINGNILTSINGQDGGGTVFFYSPNGVVIGANAAINVGSLGLTTSNLLDDGNGNWLTGFGNGTMTLNFQPSNAGGYVRIDPGATVSVLGQSNFIALVAPKVDLQGTLRTDGVAALVAAEAATMTIRDSGLWDIQVTTGTTDNQGVYVSGAIQRTTAAVGYDHHAYLVSVAKNDAMTMLFGAGTQLGFEVAGSAAVEDNVVVLSAGQDIVNGEIAGGSSSDSSVTLDGVNVSSNLVVGASNSISINSDGGTATFGRNVTLNADDIDVRASNNNLSIGGNLTASASRTGIAGQSVTAGDITVQAANGKSLTIGGDATLTATGIGGEGVDDGLTAGSGTGGNILVQAYDGGNLTVTGALNAIANGEGGGTAYGNGTGGFGQGGTVQVLANGGNSHVTAGATILRTIGEGGTYIECSSCSITGGDGEGGTIAVNGSGGSGNGLTFASLSTVATGLGGASDVQGGDGQGGTSHLGSGDGTTLVVNGTYLNFADGVGGDGIGDAHGGDGFGGTAGIGGWGTAGGTITFNGSGPEVHVTAEGYGGAGGTIGGDGGYAEGGTASIYAPGVSVNSPSRQFYVSAFAKGGNAVAGTGGNALGGQANVDAVGSIAAGGGIQIRAYGQGGNGVAGGDGHGGDASLNVSTGTLTGSGVSPIEAYGVGGTASGAGQEGGDGDGGHAAIRNTGSGTLTLGAMTLSAYGLGGAAALGDAGDANGGHAEVYVESGTTNFTSTLLLDAKGTGGAGAGGGAAGGGWANIYGTGGTINFTGNVTLTTLATGGAGTSMAGGNAGGGRARLNADGATYNLSSGLTLNANAVGGAGTTGGNASGPYGTEINSGILAGNGGSITINGSANLTANATGGNALLGSGGAGGSATAGKAGVYAGNENGNGTIDLNILNVNADATGGKGGSGAAGMAGGVGGAAQAGAAQIFISTNASGTNSVEATTANLFAIGTGGNGGAGGNGTVGGAGGAGANGTGGNIIALASAANGHLDLGTLWAIGVGAGGVGGNGGTGSAGIGGAGGNGGNGEGGTTYIGTSNPGNSFTANAGLTEIDNILMFNDSYGGAGGNGGTGSGGSGVGGNGGDALTSLHVITAWGGTVTLGTVDLLNDQVGGNGGTGSTAGAGGDSYTGDIFVYATDRAGVADTESTLNIATFNARSTAHNSTGSTAGQSIALGGHLLHVVNSDVNLGNYTVAINANNGIDAASYADPIRILGGTVDVSGSFSVNTDNAMSVVLDGGTLNAGSVSLTAADFQYDLDYSPADARGTITADAISIASGKDIILDAKLVSGGDLLLDASSGAVDLGNLNAGGDIDVIAGSTIQLGNIVSGGSTDLAADGAINVGTVGSGGAIRLTSDDGSITASHLTATGNIDALAGTTGQFGNVTSGGYTNLMAGGSLNAGTIGSGGLISLGSQTGSITALSLTAAGSIDAGAGTTIQLGNIASGDYADLFAGGSVNAGTIMSGDDISVDSDTGTITLGALTADGDIDLDAGGAINVSGNTIAGGSIDFDSDGTITALNLTAGNSIGAESDGAIHFGNLSAGLVNPSGTPDQGFSIGIASETSILVGTVAGAESVGFVTGGTLTTGSITAGADVLMLANGDISVGPITAGADGRIFIADSQMFLDAGGTEESTEEFDPELVFAEVPLPTGGSITINGAVSGGSLQAAAGDDFSVGAINVAGLLFVEAGNSIATGDVQSGLSIDLTAGDLNVDSLGSILVGDVESEGAIHFTAEGSVHGGDFVAAGEVGVTAGTTITLDDVTSGGSVTLLANGAIGTGDIVAGAPPLLGFGALEVVPYDIAINSGSTITTGSLNATNHVLLAAVGNLSTGAIDAGGATVVLSDGNIGLGAVNTGGLFYVGGTAMMETAGEIGSTFDVGAIDFGVVNESGGTVAIGGGISAHDVSSYSAGNFSSGAINASGYALVGSFAAVTVGNVAAAGSVALNAEGGALSAGTVGSNGGSISLDASTTIATQSLSAAATIDLDAGTGITVSGPINAGGTAQIYSSSGPVNLGAITAGDDANIETAGVITGSTVNAGGSISVWGNGGVTLTNLTAGTGGVEIGSGGNVALGTINAPDAVLLNAGGNLTAGNIVSGDDVIANVGGAATFGAVTTNGEGLFSITGYEAPTLAGIGTQAVSGGTGGNVQINGAVNAGQVLALAGGNLTTQAINAYSVDAEVGGTATINGMWNVSYADVASNDIAIGANGGIDAYSIELFSTNANQTVIGGGLTTTAYLLDSAEFSKLTAPYIEIVGRSDASAAIDMVIGDLNLKSNEGFSIVNFAVRDSHNETTGGVMRLVGDIAGNNYGLENYLQFEAGRIEMDAGTATIALNGTGGALGGTLVFNTPHLHVAEAPILDKLAADPNYSGRDLALQTPTTTAHTDGIVKASEIYVVLDISEGQETLGIGTAEASPYSVLFQNTGTLGTRAGFVANYAEIMSPEGAAPGSIDMVVNGQLVTEEGTLTGPDVRDSLMEEDDPARFTSASTINGCGVGGGACITIPPPPPPPPPYDPGPPIGDQIVLFNDVPVGDEAFGNEETIEDNEENGGQDSATSPIEPPAPLFDTRPLDFQDETEEPVSGGGNPALIGSGVDQTGEADGQSEEEKKKKRQQQKQQQQEQK